MKGENEKQRAAPSLLIDELLEYADKCHHEARRAELAASQIARAWAGSQGFGHRYLSEGTRAKYDWNLGLRLWMARVPANEMAKQLGCTRQQVYAAAARYGWPQRPTARLDFTKAPRIVIGDETLVRTRRQ